MSDLGTYIADEHGNPVPADLVTWAKWREHADRTVRRDTLPDCTKVSTVFLGLDHSFGLGGPPVLWETMIFGGEHDGYLEEYTSREDAIKGHQRALAMAKDKTCPDCAGSEESQP